MAEGILHQAAGDLLEVHSAGSEPAGYVHPKAIAALNEINIDTLLNASFRNFELRSKSEYKNEYNES